jgi:hypothetical protein
MFRPMSAYPLISLTLSFAIACGKDDGDDTNTVEQVGISFVGRVDPSDGTQQSVSGSSSIDMRTASWVEVSSVDEDGTITSVGVSDVSSTGTFALDVDEVVAAFDFALVETFDSDDRMVTAAIVEQATLQDSDKRRLRMDAETTIEAMVWLQRLDGSGSASGSDFTDLRTLIDARLAGAVYEEWERNGEAQDEVLALSTATQAAHLARVALFKDRGWNGDGSDLYDGSAVASQRLTTSLFSASDATADQDAWLTFYEERETAFALEGLHAEDRVDGNSAAALAFRLVIETDGTLSANLEDEADRSSAMYEAWSVYRVIVETSDDADLPAAAAAAVTFWQDVSVAPDSTAVVEAYNRLAGPIRLSMGGMAEGSIGGIDLLVDELFASEINGVLGAELDVAIDGVIVDFETSADVGVDATHMATFWTDLRASVRSLVEGSELYGSSTIIAASELMLHASAGHRAAF